MNSKDIKKNISKGIKKLGKKISNALDEMKEIISYNFYDYVEEYGDYTFEEREFNEVDNLIFSTIAYVNYKDIVSENNSDKKSIFTVSKEFFKKYTKRQLNKNITATKVGIKLLEKISKTRRFRDVLVFNYLYMGNDDSQFSAITFDLGHRLYYVSFEGTDKLISGWEEDCKMAYSFPVEAHKLAKKYLSKYTFKNVKLILGGHSKGGNLALVSAMYTNFLIRFKIKKIYNNDGQGLRDNQIKSLRYRRIKKKYCLIIPDSSIVGLILRHDNDFIVVKSNMPGLFSHDPSTWQISRDNFRKAKLTRFSRVFDEGFSKWLDNYDDNQRKIFVEGIFDILRQNNVETLLQFKTNYKLVLDLLKSSKNVDPVIKKMGKELFKVISLTNLEYPLFK